MFQPVSLPPMHFSVAYLVMLQRNWPNAPMCYQKLQRIRGFNAQVTFNNYLMFYIVIGYANSYLFRLNYYHNILLNV